MAEPMYSAKHYAIKAQKQADRAKEYAENVAVSSFGNIGDIKYTSRTDVPNGGAWCDGAEYTQAQFPDLYQMLVDGKLQHTDYTTFDESVSTNGSCGFFGLNTETTSFKAPKLSNVYLKAGQAPLMFGAESLPNITGQTKETGICETAEGAFYVPEKSSKYYSNQNGNYTGFLAIDASRSSSTYQDGAKVNPDHVIYRAYVVLYSLAAEASEAQAAEFINGLANKANTDLSNVSSNIDYVVESGSNETSWYRKYKSGWLEQGGVASVSEGIINLLRPYADTKYIIHKTYKNTTATSSINMKNICAYNVTTTSFYVRNNNSLKDCSWLTMGQGA